MKKSFDKLKLMDALVKRAEGFFYTEEVSEFSIVEQKDKDKNNSEEILENKSNFIEIENDNILENINNKKSLKNSGSKIKEQENTELYLGQNVGSGTSNCGVINENSKNLMLVKKKVTTHYIPPDLSAIKILLEDFGQEIKGNDMLDDMSDDELLKLRNEIVKELNKND